MTHLGEAKDCPGCKKKKESLESIFRLWVDEVQKEFPDAHISWTFRTQEEQDALFAKGPDTTRLKWPNSKHNVMKDGKPCAEAVDFFRLTPQNASSYEVEFFKKISLKLEDWQAPVKWGGNFITVYHKKDYDHFELDRNLLKKGIV